LVCGIEELEIELKYCALMNVCIRASSVAL
jgi:hypothetical protein